MTHKYLRWQLLLWLVLLSFWGQAQIVGTNAFLQGNYAEVGVNTCGAFASNAAPPAGYVFTGLSGLNFVADSDLDGWDAGTPNYCGDYAIPGSPVEGWGIQLDGVSYYNTDLGCGVSSIPGEITAYNAAGDSVEVIWQGTLSGVTITQRSVLHADDLYFVTWVTLSNESGSDFTDVYYRRNIDPDNEQLATGSYTTINTVEANPFMGDPYSIVTGIGETYGCYLAIVANNLFSMASRGNFGTTSGLSVSDSYTGLSGFFLDGTATEDAAIQMSFWVPALPNGGSATFAFAYVFSEDAVEDALEDTYITSDESTDVGIISYDAPETGCGLGLEAVTVNMYNYGFEPQSDIPVFYQVDGGAVVSETIAGPVDPGTFAEYTFTALADLSAVGDHTISAWTELPGDTVLYNDTADVVITNVPVISGFPYTEDFEGGSGGWTSGGTNSSWELGYPSASIIDGPPPGTPSSENSWATALYDYYNISEDSWVKSPCFDFSSLAFPYVKFDIWWETQDFWDGARLEYSLDAGASWTAIGGVGTGDNWYPSGGCFSFGFDPFTGIYYPAWDGSSGSWKTAVHDLSFLAGEPQVQLRMHFKSYVFTPFYDGIAFDNFFVGDPYDNDIGVVALIDPSSGPALGAAEAVTVQIENFGVLDQSGFNVSYQMDGGPVVTELFTGTVTGGGGTATHTFATTEDLSADGDYTFIAWTELGTDEDLSNDTLIQVVSNLLPITGTDGYYIYSNVYGGPEPWFTTSGQETMDAVYGPGEWTLGFYETLDPEAVFSTSTCFVWMEGGDAMASELETFFDNNTVLIENWVASGGHLFVNSAPNEGDGMSFHFGGVNLFYAYYTNTAEAFDASHPIFDGPFTPVGTSWSGGSFGHAVIQDGGFDTVIVDQFSPSQVVLAEKGWGAGRVMFGGMTPFAFHSPLAEATNLRYNIVSYLASCVLSDIDLGIASIIDPANGCGLGDEAVTVKIRNYGGVPQSDIPVNYQLDGGAVVSETWIGTLDPGETVEYTFTALGDFSALGDHDLVAWTSFPGDTIPGNDTADAVITNIPVVDVYPYLEAFEAGSGGWTSGGTNSTWAQGTPAGLAITGTGDGSDNAWMTSNLIGYYNNNEQSYVLGPCFDFTPLVLPYVELDFANYSEDFWDGAQLQYSLDAGASWEVVGMIGTGDNWYTNYGIGFGFDPDWPFGYPEGWVGSDGSWKTAHHDISFLAGEPQVQFRIFFASDGSVNWYDGFAFDNFKIADPLPDDIGVIDITAPNSAPDLGTAESVTVEIQNFGTLSQTGFPVSYQVDGGTIVTETFTGTLDPGAIADFTFAATADFSDDGDYAVCAWTSLAGDDDVTNDSICETISNLLPVTGDDAYYIYSNVYGGSEPWFTVTNSDAMDSVFTDGWDVAYFEDLDPAAIFSAATCFVWLEGGDAMANELEDFLNDNIVLIEGWVASGGHLLLNSAPNEGDGMDFGFDGTELVYSWYTNTAEIYDDAHPTIAGPFLPVGTTWTGGSWGHASVEGDFDTVVIDQFTPSRVVVAEKDWGAGHVVFGGMTPTFFHSPAPEAFNWRANLLAYLADCATAPIDLRMNALVAPEGGCGMGEETVTVEIENLSGVPVSDVTVGFTVDGGPATEEVITDVIDAYEVYTYTFVATADLSVAGDHTIATYVDYAGDIDASNDEIETTVTSLETPTVDLGSNGTYCDELTLDAGNPGSNYVWSTGATTQEIVITESGTYSVSVTNPVTGCVATDDISVTMEFSPTASFTYTAVGLTVTFTNTSTGGASYSWNFGDGGTSTEANPTHVYTSAGVYNVTLTVTNGCGSDFYSAVLSAANAIDDVELASMTQLYPNPTSGKTVLTMDFNQSYDVTLEVTNSLGQVVWSALPGMVQYKTIELDLSGYADGVYTLTVHAGDHVFTKPVVLNK
ncbi:MAG: PKD domain-containing protein [Chitinophagales bacterium]|nr:PKD domain-containing protein [Chitinophagales bacterium]